MGYSPWGLKELNTTDQLYLHFHFIADKGSGSAQRLEEAAGISSRLSHLCCKKTKSRKASTLLCLGKRKIRNDVFKDTDILGLFIVPTRD